MLNSRNVNSDWNKKDFLATLYPKKKYWWIQQRLKQSRIGLGLQMLGKFEVSWDWLGIIEDL